MQNGAVRRDGQVEPEPEQPHPRDRDLSQRQGRAERRQDVLQGQEVVHQRPHQGQGRTGRQELQVRLASLGEKGKSTHSIIQLFRVKLQYEFTPGYINNKVKLMLNRAPIPALGMSDYSVCAALENQYPPFSKEFLGFDLNQDLKV